MLMIIVMREGVVTWPPHITTNTVALCDPNPWGRSDGWCNAYFFQANLENIRNEFALQNVHITYGVFYFAELICRNMLLCCKNFLKYTIIEKNYLKKI